MPSQQLMEPIAKACSDSISNDGSGNREFDEIAALAFDLASRAFVYPDETFAASVSSGAYAAAWEELASAFEVNAEPLPTGPNYDLRTLRIEHTNLFLNLPHALVSPYESVWKSDKGARTLVFANDIALAVRDAYRRAGFSPSGMTEPADHIAYELGFIGELLKRDDASTATSFWHEHVADWIDGFCAAIGDARDDGFYASLASSLPLVLKRCIELIR